MLTEVVQAALRICDGTEFFPGKICPFCGGILSGYDTRVKRFAVLSETDTARPVEVILHRAYCRSCGRTIMPHEPFYPGTRIGSPVVDLCQALSVSLSSGHVAAMLNRMGVNVDRWSARTYCNLPISPPPTIPAFGMPIPVSIITLSALSGDTRGAGHISGDEILAACNYPSQYRILR
ncbi:MAG: hypothetical protein CVV32_11530 [Methanomicrobiales archaeon HGW-Methanomicrobiales-3]|jgi:hypothetical protein|nr:MAG: hypothetical protein CVV32_11530 [Methanomicrobiales archaeon HGW-Methanomicrobiales-3]